MVTGDYAFAIAALVVLPIWLFSVIFLAGKLWHVASPCWFRGHDYEYEFAPETFDFENQPPSDWNEMRCKRCGRSLR